MKGWFLGSNCANSYNNHVAFLYIMRYVIVYPGGSFLQEYQSSAPHEKEAFHESGLRRLSDEEVSMPSGRILQDSNTVRTRTCDGAIVGFTGGWKCRGRGSDVAYVHHKTT